MAAVTKNSGKKTQFEAVVAQNALLQDALKEKGLELDVARAELEWFKRQFNLDQARQYAPSSEAAHSLQSDLFNEAEAVLEKHGLDADEKVTVPEHKRSKKTKTPTISDDMVKQVIVHDLDEAQRICQGDESVLKPIGYESRRELVIIPEQVYAVEHRYTKYACGQCDQSIKTTPREPRISTGLCSPQAAAAVVVNKFADHLPLYRQSQRYSRSGIKIDRTTLARWVIKHGQAIQPLINLCQDQLRSYPYQQLDETGQKVLKPKVKKGKKKKKGGHKGYFWVQRGGPPHRPVVLYRYDGSRSGAVARSLLQGYEGCVQTDAYKAYFGIMDELSISHALCHAHARRRFVDAIKAIKDPKIAEHTQAMVAVNHYKALYHIEKELREGMVNCKDIDQWHALRLKTRQEKSLPAWNSFLQWAEETLRTVRPTSHLGEAVGYLIKHKTQLAVYLENPLVEIDNNLVENRIRPVALGRRNWLFSDTEHGAKASGNLYSLINTAMLNGHNPYNYLVQVFKELPAAKSVDEIEALLPWNIVQPTVD